MVRNCAGESTIMPLARGFLSMVCFLIALAASPALAQTDQGAITGVVQDAQGAVIPGAKVTLVATDTSFSLAGTSKYKWCLRFLACKDR